MADVMVNNSEWDQLDPDAQNAIMSAVSQSFGYNVVPSSGGALLSTEPSAASAEAAAGEDKRVRNGGEGAGGGSRP